jgi:DNA-binding transcriptional regulator YhcF (GntR family)
MSASWGEYEWVSKGELVKVSRGELITSYRKLANACGVSVGCVRRAMKSLEVAKTIAVSAAHGRTRIYVMNYAKYNDVDCATRTRTDTVVDTPTDTHKEEEKEDKEKTLSDFPEMAVKAADYLRGRVIQEDPDCQLAKAAWEETTKLRHSWTKQLDLLNRKDGRDWKDIRAVIDWVYDEQDMFVVESATSLRKKWDKIAKQRKRSAGKQPANRDWRDRGGLKILSSGYKGNG